MCRSDPAERNPGRRHAGYGVRDEHYDALGEAPLWTPAQGLGDGFTDEVEEAWATAYGVLAATMKDAAAEVTA